MIIVSYAFQFLPSIKNEESFAAFIVPVLAAFFADLAMQMTPAGMTIDKPVNYSTALLLSKCGMLPRPVAPTTVQDQEVYNLVVNKA